MRSPPSMTMLPDAWRLSSSVRIVNFPPAIYIFPRVESSVFSALIPLPSLFSTNTPSAILTLSLPDRHWLTAFTVILPPVITRSSFETIPCLYSALISRLPAPFRVRSALLNIAPSTVFSSVSVYSAPPPNTFLLPSASVRKTLSASRI